MFQPLSLFVGLRYVRARTHKFFVSFITWASLAGVCVGVAALIVILSVMNGLENELRDQLIALSAHARVVAQAEDTRGAPRPAPTQAQWKALESLIRAGEGVTGVARYIEIQALAVHTPEMLPVVLRGIDPQSESTITDLGRALVQGSLQDLTAGSDRVIVGEVIAERLGLAVGDSLTVLVPAVSEQGAPSPRLRELTVAGIFEIGRAEHDGTLVFANIEDVRALTPAGATAEGLRIRFRDALAAPTLAARLRARLPPGFELFDWTQDNANYFRAVR